MRSLSAGTVLGASMVFKMLCGLALIKLFAVTLTVEEFGQAGQFMTLSAMLTLLAGAAQTHGLIKLLSGAGADKIRSREILRASHGIWAVTVLLLATVLLLMRGSVSELLVQRADLGAVMPAIVIGLAGAGLNAIQIATLSAAGRLRLLVLAQSLGILCGTVAGGVLAVRFGLPGAVAGFALIGVWNAVFSTWATRRAGLITLAEMRPRFDPALTRALLGYSGALTLAAMMMPLAHFYARAELFRTLGWQEVGRWQAIAKLSEAALQVFGAFLNHYVLAILARMRLMGDPDLRAFTSRIAALLFGCAALGFGLIYLLRNSLIPLLFSDAYLEIGPLLPMQFFADSLRLLVALASLYCLSARYMALYIGAEVAAALLFSGGVRYFATQIGEGAAVWAHLAAYSILLPVLLIAILWRDRRG